MAPLRRYLRITPRSVLEVRIYLDNPADQPRWLCHPVTPALPRIIAAIRPLVLPKLREENDIASGKLKSGAKGKKKKGGVKDTIVEEDFEVSVFLTQTSTRHAVLRKQKTMKGEKGRLGSEGRRITAEGTEEAPVVVDEAGAGDRVPGLRREESDEGDDRMENIPAEAASGRRDVKKEDTFVVEDDDDEEEVHEGGGEVQDDKKKMGMETRYEGFSIYGRILCLVVKRRGTAKGRELPGGAGQAMMEEWIGTQVAREEQGMGATND
ncbi:uncharacterized protein KY384_001781 [Bacidia gigantensis]|uniref:uncharacterized protein n=1 Tax=Bacidia gigantensis TaxID=2732470 RepID=UPI001D054232|nr:uncharacterized protein KY384_001781 [Bacidia gigantensis]KAG8532999.1 hypothetical protein KY384_001781 [Bacidia gigantensis]